MTITLQGKGLLGGMVLDQDKVDRELAAEREKDKHYAEQLAALEKRYNEIDVYLDSYLRDELDAEAAHKPITELVLADWKRFQRYCDEYSFPQLPPDARAVAEFLILHGEDAKHATRLRDSIATVLRAFEDGRNKTINAACDIRVNAVLRLFRKEEEAKHESKKARKVKKGQN